MKNVLITIFIGLLLGGCIYINERGISGRYYNECKEYYDATGTYHKDCDENLLDFEDLNPAKYTK
jgi:uncharacterized protein YceK